ncbi:MAG: Ig-like domain-containing protein, partial [Desulfobacteraceae bacterium]
MMLTSGCGDEGSNTNQKPEDNITAAESGTGSAVFSVQWHTASDNPAAADVLTSQLAGEDCTTVGVVTITCELYDESGTLIASGGPWNCDDHEGVIYRIPPGPDITFAVLGWGDADQTSLIYHGQRTGVTITPGLTEDVGTIDAYEIVPADFSATTISNSQVDLAWTVSPDITGAIAGYRIYRDGAPHATAAASPYRDTGLDPTTRYCYTVSAFDAYGNESIQSDQDCATTNENQAPTVNITAPADGTAVDQGDSVTFSGTAEDPEDGTLTGEALVWTSNIDDQIGTGNTFATATLSAGVHTITLTATDQQGAYASASITLTVNDAEAPTVPVGLTGSPIGGSGIDLSWSASSDNVGVTGYRIYRDGVEVGTSASTTYSDTGLNPAMEYCYTVTAYDAAGNESGQSTQVCVTTIDTIAPSVPTGLTGIPSGGDSIDLSWSASTDNVGVTGYRIYRDGVEVDTSTTTTYSDTGLNSATQYCYTVTAYDAVGNESGQSGQVCVTTEDTIAPTVPGDLQATGVSSSQIDLIWTASTDNVGVALYRIYRGGTLLDTTPSTTFSDSGLSPATQYCYTVT